MTFKDLKVCPFCGNDTFYEKQRVKGYLYYNMRFDGNDAHNEELYDYISVSNNGKAYCCRCNQYLGNYIDDKASKSVEKNKRRKYGMKEELWISVKERLPTNDGEYLTTVKGYGSDKPYVTMLCYANEFTEIMSLDTGCNSGWYRYSSEWGYYACDRVVAWQELPEPYKGENNR